MRELQGGAVAVGAYNKAGGTPAGVVLVESGAYCSNATGVDNKQSFGYSLATCAAAVQTSPRCAAARSSGGLFYYSEGYNGGCSTGGWRHVCSLLHLLLLPLSCLSSLFFSFLLLLLFSSAPSSLWCCLPLCFALS